MTPIVFFGVDVLHVTPCCRVIAFPMSRTERLICCFVENRGSSEARCRSFMQTLLNKNGQPDITSWSFLCPIDGDL